MTRYYEGAHDFTGATVTGVGGGQTIYDAIVDSGGGEDYTTLGAAVTAGAKFILIKDGTTTETGAITLPSGSNVIGESHLAIVNMQGNILNVNGSSKIENLKIRSAATGGQILLLGNNITFQHCFFENDQNSNPAARYGMIDDNAVARVWIRIDNCTFKVAPDSTDIDNRQAISQRNAGSFFWKISNCSFYGDSTATRVAGIKLDGVNNEVINCSFYLWGESNDMMIYLNSTGNVIQNITVADSLGRFYIFGNKNVFSGMNSQNVINVTVDNDGNAISDIVTAGSITFATTAADNSLSGSCFDAGITINGDYNTVNGCRAGAVGGGGAGTITIASGADNNIVIGCKTDAAISDSGSGNILTSNQVY